MTMQDKQQTMTTADTREGELVKAIKNATTPEERRKAVRELARHNIERNRPVYDRLAQK